MQTRLIICLLLSSCYAPESDSPEGEQAETVRRAVTRSSRGAAGSSHCSDEACVSQYAIRHEPRTRDVRISTPKPEPKQPSLGISVDVPISVVDCTSVGLTIVGPWLATVGDSIVLQAVARGAAEESALSWQMPDGEVTVLGPLTAEIKCTQPGMHKVVAEFAPPSPCPATLAVEIECEAPAAE